MSNQMKKRLFLTAAAITLLALMFGSSTRTVESQSNPSLIISEFRLRGPNPNSANNEYIEIYNNSDAAHTVNASDGSAGYAVAASDGVARCVIPNGTVIPARGHFLCTNSIGYSLALHPAGNGTTATGNANFTTDIPDNAGIALFRTTTPSSFTFANRLDAVGSTSEANTLYKEGTGYPALTPFAIDYAFYRDDCGKSGSIPTPGPCVLANPKDTSNNAADFIFVDTNGTSAGAGQRLGAPAPENLSSPAHGLLPNTATVAVSLLDPARPSDSSPNFVRDFTSNPGLNATFGTSSIRRTFTNVSNQPITRLRFRVIDLTTFPAPSGIADLRPFTSGSFGVTLTDGSAVTVRGTALEQPPAQLNGGGFNSILSVNTVSPSNPLLPGASVHVQFLMGVQQDGTQRFELDIPINNFTTGEMIISPQAGANVGPVPVTIYGNSFAPDVQVSLRRAGQPDIVGSPVRVLEDGRIILTSFNLQGVAVGAWDVVLSNPGGGTRTLEGAFQVFAATVGFVSPSKGGNGGTLSVNVIGRGFRDGATVRLVRAGQADVPGVRPVVSEGGTLVTTSFDLRGRATGPWSVVVKNPDGLELTRPDGFLVEAARGGVLRVNVVGRTTVRPGQRERLSVVYENDGNNDIDARLIVVSGDGASFATGDGQEFRPTLRIFSAGASAAAGRISPGSTYSVELLMTAANLNSATVSIGVVDDEAVPFDWNRLATENVPESVTPQQWAEIVARARPLMGESFAEVMAAVRNAANRSLQDPRVLTDFDRLLVYVISVYGTPPTAPAPLLRGHARRTGVAAAGAEPSLGAEDVSLITIGNEVPNAERNVIITHGLGGLHDEDGNRKRQDFFDLADAIKANCGSVNVYIVDWSEGADKTMLGGLPDPWEAAANIDPAGDAAYQQLKAKQLDPSKTTFYGESFGNYVNARIAKNYKDESRVKVSNILAGNPANSRGGYPAPDLTQLADKSAALHTYSFADESKKIADYDLFLDTMKSGPIDQHTSSVKWLEGCVTGGDCSWTTLDKPLQKSDADSFDGSAENDCEYDPLPVPRKEPSFLDRLFPRDRLRHLLNILIVTSRDPNDKSSVPGVGAQRFVDGSVSRLPYTIFFENVATATAPAQVVTITDQLDASLLDLSTFSLGPITFGERTVVPPTGLNDFTTEVDLRPATDLLVRIEARLNVATGLATWKFTSLDTLTGLPTGDPFAGFLPPNVQPPEGDGSVSFSISTKGELATGTAVRNMARIVFDTNDPIDTPEWLNTIDRTAPQSHVLSLAAAQPAASFDVSWAGTDEGSGVARYTIFVSENGGPFNVWLNETNATSGVFQGQPNRRYDFYSVARDEVGNTEPQPSAADATTRTIPSTFQFTGAQLVVAEDAGAGDLIVTRAGDLTAAASVRYETEDGTASERSDYLIALGTLNFAPGETQKPLRVFINDDVLTEGDETLRLRLSSPTPGVSGLGSVGIVTLTISDNDTLSGPSPVGWGPDFDPRFFVRQHYLDFLNREPDPSGFDFWTREITDCGSALGCQEVKRVHVSAAFFLSIEFQETGYLVYRAYKAAYGNISPARPVPVRLREFLLDTQEIGRGVVVHMGDWETQLENNKRAYFNSLVAGARFTSAFPTTMTAAEFVDKLNANTGGVLSQAERNALVGELSAASNSPSARAGVLRKVAEDADLVRGEFNRAFVLMQYFGYLRREPDNAPDADFTGYNFWLTKLNQFNGNFVEAEMVKAFITSDEYKKRFGQ